MEKPGDIQYVSFLIPTIYVPMQAVVVIFTTHKTVGTFRVVALRCGWIIFENRCCIVRHVCAVRMVLIIAGEDRAKTT